jgi:hypothetical protein
MKWRTRLILGAGLAAVVVLGFACPCITGPRLPHDPAHAENTTFNLKNAISAYHTEYHEYPLLDPSQDLTVDSGHALMDVLFGSDAHGAPGGRNPRGITFYSDKAAARMGDGRFRKGVTVDDPTAGELWDPWGNHYRVRLDTNGDGKIENPEAPVTQIPESIAIWSAGPDGDFETWKDNVKSW